MKKLYTLSLTILLIVLLCMPHQSLMAQGFVWVKSYGGLDRDKGKELGVDQFGNQFLAGFFTNEMTLGTTTLQAVGKSNDQDIFISKLDVLGDPEWAHSFGNGISAQPDYPFGLSVNTDGFCAATGKCHDYVKLDNGDSIPAFNQDDMWLISYNPDGTLNWIKVGGGNKVDMGSAVYVDADENIYCAGNFEGDIDFFGDSMLTVSNDPHVYAAKYAWDGSLLWIKYFSSASPVQVHDMKVDGNGNIYLSGNFLKTVDFGTFSLTSFGDGDGFVLKINQAGDVLWATSFGSTTPTSFETGSTIDLDDNGNCYVASTFAYDCNYDGGYLLTNAPKNVMVAAYDPNGNFLWANAFKGGPSVKFSPITLSMSVEENILLTGIFAGIDTIGSIVLEPYNSPDSADAFIFSMSLAGDVFWAIHAGGDGNDGGFGISGNNTTFAYATGNFRDAGQFGSNNLVSNGVSDIYVAKFEKTTITGAGLDGGIVNFALFPNPFLDQFTIALPEQTTNVTILNTLGQIIYESKIAMSEGQITVDLHTAHPGLYLLEMKGEYGTVTSKLEKLSY